jgi:hypothetical protein
MPRLKPLDVREPTVSQQRCSKCGRTKSADEFHRDRLMLSGLRSMCKDCANERDRAHYKLVGKPRTSGQRRAERARAAARQGKDYRPRASDNITAVEPEA